MYVTVIEQDRAGETATVKVAFEPAETGDVMRTRVTVAEAVATTRSASTTTTASRVRITRPIFPLGGVPVKRPRRATGSRLTPPDSDSVSPPVTARGEQTGLFWRA